jgi:tetratricopeptide (TPR) repeat protein
MTAQAAKQLLQQGIARFHMGDRAHALELIEQAAQLDPYHEQAWLWLAGLSRDLDQRRFYLNQVLLINPQNQAALQGLEELQQKPQASLAQLSQLPLETSSGKETINLQTINLQALSASRNILANISSDSERTALVELIIKELKHHNPKNDIILKIGQSYHLTWSQSEALIDVVAEQYRDRIEVRSLQSILVSPFAAIATIVTIGLFGIICANFSPVSLNRLIPFGLIAYSIIMFVLLIAFVVHISRKVEKISLHTMLPIVVISIHLFGSLVMACVSTLVFFQ